MEAVCTRLQLLQYRLDGLEGGCDVLLGAALGQGLDVLCDEFGDLLVRGFVRILLPCCDLHDAIDLKKKWVNNNDDNNNYNNDRGEGRPLS